MKKWPKEKSLIFGEYGRKMYTQCQKLNVADSDIAIVKVFYTV